MAIIDHKDGISRDTHVLGDNVYFGLGQGCGTIWFKTVGQARSFLKKHGEISGRDSSLCKKCQCHYSSLLNPKEYQKYPDFACGKWKEQIKET